MCGESDDSQAQEAKWKTSGGSTALLVETALALCDSTALQRLF